MRLCQHKRRGKRILKKLIINGFLFLICLIAAVYLGSNGIYYFRKGETLIAVLYGLGALPFAALVIYFSQHLERSK